MATWKVTILGDRGTGKTALGAQFSVNSFSDVYDPIMSDYRKQLVVDDKVCLVEVINTSGLEENDNLRDHCIREGHGSILVYSVTSRATFEHVEVHHQTILKAKEHRPVFVLVGNKCDKQLEREVSREEGAAMARSLGCDFLETSAKTAQNVEKLFTDLVRKIRSSEENADRPVPTPVPPVEPKSRTKSVISRIYKALWRGGVQR